MKRFLRFLALALVGFGVGVGFAFFQKSRNVPPPLPTEMASGQINEAPLPEITEAEKRGELAEELKMPESEMIKASDAIASMGGSETESNETKNDIDAPLLANAPAMPDVDHDMKDHDMQNHDMADHDHATMMSDRENIPPASSVASTGLGGAFTLTDANGNKVTEKSWPGKLKLVFFGFTHCPDVCPMALDKIETALDILGNPQNIQPIFITIDPARDDVETMKRYVDGYDMNLVGLTGTTDQINDVKRTYKVYAAKSAPQEGDEPSAYLMGHSSYIYLMDENEKMLTIAGDSSTAKTLAEKLKPYTK